MSHAGNPARSVIVSNNLAAALMGGLAGGIAFGMLMQVTDIMLSVAALVDSSRTTIGWTVHLSISLLFGMIYVLLAGVRVRTIVAAAFTGIVYGWFWWILGGMIIMPAWLGREDLIFRFTATAGQSLAGHMMYGLLLGLVYGGVMTRLGRPMHGRFAAAPSPVHRYEGGQPVVPQSRRKSAAALFSSSHGISAARHDRRR